VKIHFRTSEPICKRMIEEKCEESYKVKHFINFSTLHLNEITYSVFHHTPVVNASGINSFTEIDKCIDLFSSHFNVQCFSPCVDNSTCVGSVTVRVPAYSSLKACEETYVTVRTHCFPAVIIRTKQPFHGGTVVLFPSGKFTLLGCKSEAEILYTIQRFSKIIASPV